MLTIEASRHYPIYPGIFIHTKLNIHFTTAFSFLVPKKMTLKKNISLSTHCKLTTPRTWTQINHVTFVCKNLNVPIIIMTFKEILLYFYNWFLSRSFVKLYLISPLGLPTSLFSWVIHIICTSLNLFSPGIILDKGTAQLYLAFDELTTQNITDLIYWKTNSNYITNTKLNSL